jgi:hypothetical protein
MLKMEPVKKKIVDNSWDWVLKVNEYNIESINQYRIEKGIEYGELDVDDYVYINSSGYGTGLIDVEKNQAPIITDDEFYLKIFNINSKDIDYNYLIDIFKKLGIK